MSPEITHSLSFLVSSPGKLAVRVAYWAEEKNEMGRGPAEWTDWRFFTSQVSALCSSIGANQVTRWASVAGLEAALSKPTFIKGNVLYITTAAFIVILLEIEVKGDSTIFYVQFYYECLRNIMPESTQSQAHCRNQLVVRYKIPSSFFFSLSRNLPIRFRLGNLRKDGKGREGKCVGLGTLLFKWDQYVPCLTRFIIM